MPDSAIQRRPLTRRKRLLFVAFIFLIAYALAEGLAWIVIETAHGGLGTVRRTRQAAASTEPLSPVNHAGNYVIHPYLGYVSVPTLKDERGLRVTDYGFYDADDPLPKRAEGKLNVVIVGGSVAEQLSVDAAETLTAKLAAGTGKQIHLVRLAQYGYKQPQQFIAVAYHLMLGAEFDVVINLDGFNEVVLAQTDNVPNGVCSTYPRVWHRQVAETSDYETLSHVARIAVLKEQMQAGAERLNRSVFRYSPLANLIWKVRFDRTAAEIMSQEKAFGERNAARKEYWVTGPPEKFDSPDDLNRRCVDVWARGSRQLRQLCAANGIRYYHFLQPNQYLPGSKPMSDAERQIAVSELSGYKPHVETCFPLLREAGAALKAEGEQFHDLTQMFATTEEPLYSDAACHFNLRGSSLIAAQIAKAIAADFTQ